MSACYTYQGLYRKPNMNPALFLIFSLCVLVSNRSCISRAGTQPVNTARLHLFSVACLGRPFNYRGCSFRSEPGSYHQLAGPVFHCLWPCRPRRSHEFLEFSYVRSCLVAVTGPTDSLVGPCVSSRTGGTYFAGLVRQTSSSLG